MLNGTFMSLLFSVISSWQVIAAVVAVLLYLTLVFYVARLHKPSRFASSPRAGKGGKKREAVPAPPPDAEDGLDDD